MVSSSTKGSAHSSAVARPFSSSHWSLCRLQDRRFADAVQRSGNSAHEVSRRKPSSRSCRRTGDNVEAFRPIRADSPSTLTPSLRFSMCSASSAGQLKPVPRDAARSPSVIAGAAARKKRASLRSTPRTCAPGRTGTVQAPESASEMSVFKSRLLRRPPERTGRTRLPVQAPARRRRPPPAHGMRRLAASGGRGLRDGCGWRERADGTLDLADLLRELLDSRLP